PVLRVVEAERLVATLRIRDHHPFSIPPATQLRRWRSVLGRAQIATIVHLRLTQRSATGASRRWRSISLLANRLAPVGCTVWFAAPLEIACGGRVTENPNRTLVVTIRDIITLENRQELGFNAADFRSHSPFPYRPVEKARTDSNPLDFVERIEALVTPVSKVINIGFKLLGIGIRVQYN